MASKSLLAALALTVGITALAAPTLLSAHDRSGRWGGMMGGFMMGGAQAGGVFDFAAADADGDGKVTKDELAAYRKAHLDGIDADGDNLISAEELAAKMMAEMQARIDARAQARIAARDADGDGKLSVEELIAPPMAGRLFDRMDADGDGAVSEEEAAAMHKHRGAMAGQGGHMWGGQGGEMHRHHMSGQGMYGHGMMQGPGGWFFQPGGFDGDDTNCGHGMGPDGMGAGSGAGTGQ